MNQSLATDHSRLKRRLSDLEGKILKDQPTPTLLAESTRSTQHYLKLLNRTTTSERERSLISDLREVQELLISSQLTLDEIEKTLDGEERSEYSSLPDVNSFLWSEDASLAESRMFSPRNQKLRAPSHGLPLAYSFMLRF